MVVLKLICHSLELLDNEQTYMNRSMITIVRDKDSFLLCDYLQFSSTRRKTVFQTQNSVRDGKIKFFNRVFISVVLNYMEWN